MQTETKLASEEKANINKPAISGQNAIFRQKIISDSIGAAFLESCSLNP